MEEYNVYCDETCHLENDNNNIMVIGCVYCKKNQTKDINDRLKRIKETFRRSARQELKWTKLSKSNLKLAEFMIRDFFDDEDLHFRAIIIDKTKLDFEKHAHLNFKTFYYVAYYEMLKSIVSPNAKYNIYLDIKDTNSQERIVALKNYLDYYMNKQFNKKLISTVQHVRSHEIQILQITDILIGAISYSLRNLSGMNAKTEIVNLIKKLSGYDFTKTTLLREEKFNLLVFTTEGSAYEF